MLEIRERTSQRNVGLTLRALSPSSGYWRCRGLRLHRGLLQHGAPPLRTAPAHRRHAVAGGVRTPVVAGSSHPQRYEMNMIRNTRWSASSAASASRGAGRDAGVSTAPMPVGSALSASVRMSVCGGAAIPSRPTSTTSLRFSTRLSSRRPGGDTRACTCQPRGCPLNRVNSLPTS